MDLKQIRTPHFSLEELVRSDTAEQKRIDNTPSVGVLRQLCQLLEEVLEPARVKLGAPIIVTSGYRSVDLNRAIGGVATSQHCRGQAVDLVCQNTNDAKRLFEILRKMDIDQLLWETNSKGTQWIHCSYVGAGKNRHQVNDNYRVK